MQPSLPLMFSDFHVAFVEGPSCCLQWKVPKQVQVYLKEYCGRHVFIFCSNNKTSTLGNDLSDDEEFSNGSVSSYMSFDEETLIEDFSTGLLEDFIKGCLISLFNEEYIWIWLRFQEYIWI